jgi:hypothetical protein
VPALDSSSNYDRQFKARSSHLADSKDTLPIGNFCLATDQPDDLATTSMFETLEYCLNSWLPQLRDCTILLESTNIEISMFSSTLVGWFSYSYCCAAKAFCGLNVSQNRRPSLCRATQEPASSEYSPLQKSAKIHRTTTTMCSNSDVNLRFLESLICNVSGRQRRRTTQTTQHVYAPIALANSLMA